MRRILETLVVDLSAVLAFITRGEHSIRMQFWLETASLTYATDQLKIDLADYFRKLVLQDKISTHSALAVCDNTLKLIDHYVSTTSLWQESLVASGDGSDNPGQKNQCLLSHPDRKEPFHSGRIRDTGLLMANCMHYGYNLGII